MCRDSSVSDWVCECVFGQNMLYENQYVPIAVHCSSDYCAFECSCHVDIAVVHHWERVLYVFCAILSGMSPLVSNPNALWHHHRLGERQGETERDGEVNSNALPLELFVQWWWAMRHISRLAVRRRRRRPLMHIPHGDVRALCNVHHGKFCSD